MRKAQIKGVGSVRPAAHKVKNVAQFRHGAFYASSAYLRGDLDRRTALGQWAADEEREYASDLGYEHFHEIPKRVRELLRNLIATRIFGILYQPEEDGKDATRAFFQSMSTITNTLRVLGIQPRQEKDVITLEDYLRAKEDGDVEAKRKESGETEKAQETPSDEGGTGGTEADS